MTFESARADRAVAVVLFALGTAMLYGGYAMDRLEIRQIHPASIPGLVPMLLGGALAGCAALLFAGARDDDGAAAEGVSWANAALALALCLYALGLVGRVPFFWATAAFVAVFAGVFAWRDAETRPSPARLAALSAIYGLAVSGAISALFRYGFLVRLPLMARFGEFLAALAFFATPVALFHVTWSTLLGIAIGSLPGLTATMGVALLTTLTYTLERDMAILVLICMYVSAIYGGSRSAILLNIPGTPASAATSLDGFRWRSGEAGYAMALATAGSALGTLVGIVLLVLLAPPLGEAALRFGSFEFFWLAVFGIVISGQLTGGSNPLKGYIAGILGLMVAMIGSDGIHAHIRFNLGFPELNGGIGLIPAMVGAFGFAEVLTVLWQRRAQLATTRSTSDRVLPRLSDLWRYKRTIGRSGVIGTLIGIIPGVGEDIGAWASYAAARRASRERDEFGRGSKEGLTAAETGNSAVVPGALIPALTLAVPGSAPAAVLIAALFIHGIRPGPMIMLEQPDFIYRVAAMLVMATLAILVFGLALARPFALVLKVPRSLLMPVVFALCVIGPYALTQRLFDVWVMVAFGVLGFVLRQLKFPMPPLVLGIILGDLLDKNLRRGLTLSDGDLAPFFTRPISAAVLLTLVTIAASLAPVRRAFGRVLSFGSRS